MAIQKPTGKPVDPLEFLDASELVDSKPGKPITLDYTSPVLDGLMPDETINMPQDSVACRHCPASIWMLNGRELTCYCQPLHVVIWSNDQRSAPSRCDAQIAALAQLQASVKG